jgi:uncharacterized membrane protein YbhN (UPF0104 family)
MSSIWARGCNRFGATIAGCPVSLIEAVAIESLGQGSRAAAFMLPGGLGVQDGALIAVCAIFGVPAEIALAMALIKRVSDLVLGAPALLGWQALEGRRRRFDCKRLSRPFCAANPKP